MVTKRRDNKGRVLRTGEIQEKDGRYRFKYTDSMGTVRYVRSWKLDINDICPAGKKNGPALRELEEQIAADNRDHISFQGII